MWLGGFCSLGYDVRDHQLVINPEEAKLVRYLYKSYLESGSIRLLKQTLDRRGIVSKRRVSKNGKRSGGKPFSRGALYALLANPVYIGEIRHKELRHPGQHQAIVDRKTWEEVQRRLSDQTARTGTPKSTAAANFLAGRLFDENGAPLREATGAKGRHGGRYRYYVSGDLVTDGRSLVHDKGWRLAARELERSIIVSVRAILNDQAAIATAAQEAGASTAEISSVLGAAEAKIGLLDSDSQAPLAVAELVKRLDLRKDGIEMAMDLETLLPPDSARRPASWAAFARFVPLQSAPAIGSADRSDSTRSRCLPFGTGGANGDFSRQLRCSTHGPGRTRLAGEYLIDRIAIAAEPTNRVALRVRKALVIGIALRASDHHRTNPAVGAAREQEEHREPPDGAS